MNKNTLNFISDIAVGAGAGAVIGLLYNHFLIGLCVGFVIGLIVALVIKNYKNKKKRG